MKLIELQTNFQTAILDKHCHGATWIDTSHTNLSSYKRMLIYHNAYRIRLIEVLLDSFAHTAKYLGDSWFTNLAHGYVQCHHSQHHNIALYGEDFPAFLAQQLPNDLEVAELALLDWRLRRAFDGPDSQPLTMASLQQRSQREANLRLLPVATLSLLKHSFNTLAIWQAIDNDQVPPPAKQLAGTIDIVIWRQGHAPHFRSISELEAVALRLLLMGNNIEQIGAALASQFPHLDSPKEFGLLLRRWVNDQLLQQ